MEPDIVAGDRVGGEIRDAAFQLGKALGLILNCLGFQT